MAAKKGYSSKSVMRSLRQAEVLLHEGKSIAEVCKAMSISDSTYYKRRREYGGMKVSQAKRLKDLERENSRLKKVVADNPKENVFI